MIASPTTLVLYVFAVGLAIGFSIPFVLRSLELLKRDRIIEGFKKDDPLLSDKIDRTVMVVWERSDKSRPIDGQLVVVEYSPAFFMRLANTGGKKPYEYFGVVVARYMDDHFYYLSSEDNNFVYSALEPRYWAKLPETLNVYYKNQSK